MEALTSWGRVFGHFQQKNIVPHWPDDLPDILRSNKKYLAYGNGRSYGDSCLNDGETLLSMRELNRFILYDKDQGILRCEAGVLFSDVLNLIVKDGWFLPVTPGTKFITVAGAVANDVHGKNHHVAGCFGNHVRSLELLRSDGTRNICSSTQNRELFRATIGGLGLTGIITWVEFSLQKISSCFIDAVSIKLRNLDEFIECSTRSDGDFAYSVSWMDCLASGQSLGRGLMLLGNHAHGDRSADLRYKETSHLNLPFDLPMGLLNSQTVGAFNFLYYHRQAKRRKEWRCHFDPFFYPLDAILNWNRAYGRNGFYQYQFLIPFSAAPLLREMITRISTKSRASFLNVLKTFGSIQSPGILSFPAPGFTLAIDIANDGRETLKLLDDLDEMVVSCGGRIYPAKDARMSPAIFRKSFPQAEEFVRWIDPKCSSSFWRRVWQ